MPCARIAGLKARVLELKGKYTDHHVAGEHADPFNYIADLDDLAAFRLLVHAEIEDYLESKAKDGLAAIESAFRSGNTQIRNNFEIVVIARLLNVSLNFDSARWNDDVASCLNAARTWISKNNGIKEASFSTLCVFSGKMPDEIDGSLAASLTSFGSARGDVAHTSPTRVRTIQGPSVEAAAADNLLLALDAFFT